MELVAALPPRVMIKEKLPLSSTLARRLLALLTAALTDAEAIDRRDGIKALWDGGQRWVHVRPSNTEPVVRVISEGRSRSEAEALQRRVLDEAGQL